MKLYSMKRIYRLLNPILAHLPSQNKQENVTVDLIQYRNNTDETAVSQQYWWNSSIATILMKQQYSNNTDETAVFQQY